jgi:poly(A) polymerase
LSFLEHRRFRAAYDFMVLLSEVGQVDPDIAKFWTAVQTESVDVRAKSFEMGSSPGKKRKRRRRRKKGATPASSS